MSEGHARGKEREAEYLRQRVKDLEAEVEQLRRAAENSPGRAAAPEGLTGLNLLDSIEDGFVAIDAQWRITYVNRNAEYLLRRTAETLVGKDFWKEYADLESTAAGAAFRRAMEQRISTQSEQYYAALAGWFEARYLPAPDGGIVVFFTNITERKTAEAALLRSEERWRSLANAIPQFVWVARKLRDTQFINDYWYDYTALPKGDLSTESWAEVLHPDDLPRIEEMWQQAASTGTEQSFEYRVKRAADGVYRWHLGFHRPERDGSGTIVRWIGCGFDIHDLKLAQEALRETEERQRLAIEAAGAGLWDWDIELNRVVWSDRFYEFHGLPPGSFAGTAEAFAEQLHPEDRELVSLRIREALENNEPYKLEFRVIRPDGEVRWLSTSARVLRNEQGRAIRMLGATTDITDRKRRDDAISLLGAIVDSSDDAIISKDLNGIITSWNQSAERLFGYTAAEAIGQPVTILAPPDRQDEEPKILARLRRSERVEHFETIRRRKDGTLFDLSLTISPVKSAEGKIIGASKIARDISDRKRAERAIETLNAQLKSDLAAMSRMQELSTRLVEAEDFEQLLGEIVDAGIEITGADMGNIQLLEEGALRIVAHRGYSAPFLEFFNSVHGGQAACGTALRRRERVIVEDVASSPVFAGTPWGDAVLATGAAAVQSTPLVTRLGRIVGIFSTHYRQPRRPSDRELRLLDVLARQAADLIERKRAETALLASETRFRQLADSMPQMVWTARPDGFTDYYNERWYEFTGIARDRFGDASFEPLLHPEDRKRCHDTWYQSVASGQPYRAEYRFWDRRESRWRWFTVQALPVRGHDGNIVKWFGSCTDIDEQKRTEEELRRANLDLEQFAYSAGHDLQEPLRTIKIYGELLARRYAGRLDGEALEFVKFLRDGAVRMEMLVRDLLEYTQITRIELPDTDTEAEDALAAALANLKGAISESGGAVTAGPLPAIRVHSTHLAQLFQNLIGNAIKYRSPERAPVVHVSAERRNDAWIISVQDNGIGIAPEHREQIFGLFRRLHAGDQYSGTGIGLAICQRIVERYQGRIWVESPTGNGSIFRFELPA